MVAIRTRPNDRVNASRLRYDRRVSRSPIPEAVRAIVPQTFLARVPKNLVDEILGSGRRVDVERGESLVTNTKKPGLTIVVDGLIRVFLKSSETRQITVRYARPGETLGLVHFLRAKLEVHAQPVTDSVLFAISARRLRELAETSAPLAMAIAEDCAARVADAIEELSFATFGTVRQRVARHLLDLASADENASELIAIASPKSLAEATGSVREVIARVLKDLDAAKITKKSERGIVILDATKLDEEARGVAHETPQLLE
jgi:CRP/FNR family transcriptional regulator